MAIFFTCSCGNSYDLPDSRSGQTMRCPFCFELQAVPVIEAAPAWQWPRLRPRLALSRPGWLTWRRIAVAAALMLVPVGGPLAVWVGLSGNPGSIRSALAAAPIARQDEPESPSAPQVPATLDASGELGGVGKPTEPTDARNPRNDGDPRPLGAWTGVLMGIYGDPHFIDPDVNDRLTVLYRMILAYNGRTSDMDKMDGPPRAARRDRSRLKEMAKVPTAEELRDWFTLLTPHQRIQISLMFRDRQKYLEIAREANKRALGNRDRGIQGILEGDTRTTPMGGTYERVFADPFDVFVSPRDGKPFVIGYKRVPIPLKSNGYAHDPRAIVYEQDGVDRLDRRFLEHRRERKCVCMNGQRDIFYLPANAPEVP